MSVADYEVPHSIEAEVSVIGALLLDPDRMSDALVELGPADFYQRRNRVVFRTLRELFNNAEPIDPISIVDRLRDRDQLEAAGGASYVAELLDVVPTSANIGHHLRIVRDKARLRRLISACQDTIADAISANGAGPEAVMEEAERRVFAAVERPSSDGGYYPPDEAIMEAMALIEEEGRESEGVTGVTTGLPSLDRKTTGLHAGDVTVLAARPSMGKSALAWSIATAAADAGHVVGFSSLEMSRAQIVKRGLAQRGRVDLLQIRRGQLDQEDYERLSKAAGWLHTLPLWIDDRTGATIPELRMKARRLAAKVDLALLVVDYLQLMEGAGENRTQQVGSVSRGLKLLARELSIHVLALSQLSRAVERRDWKRPRLSDLRDSGAIEQDADNVLMLWRPEFYFDESTPAPKREKWENLAELIIEKQRNGPAGFPEGLVKLHWDGPTTRFTELDLTTRDEEAPPWAT